VKSGGRGQGTRSKTRAPCPYNAMALTYCKLATVLSASFRTNGDPDAVGAGFKPALPIWSLF